MKLGKDVLLEIVDIVRRGLVEGRDISEDLRELDVEPSLDSQVVLLTKEYLKKHPRGNGN